MEGVPLLLPVQGERILRLAAGWADVVIGPYGMTAVKLALSFLCHSEHGATRSESEINMLAGGKHTAIQRRRVEESVLLAYGIRREAQEPPLPANAEGVGKAEEYPEP